VGFDGQVTPRMVFAGANCGYKQVSVADLDAMLDGLPDGSSVILAFRWADSEKPGHVVDLTKKGGRTYLWDPATDKEIQYSARTGGDGQPYLEIPGRGKQKVETMVAGAVGPGVKAMGLPGGTAAAADLDRPVAGHPGDGGHEQDD